MTSGSAVNTTASTGSAPPGRAHRLGRIAAWLGGIALVVLFLHIVGVDVSGWFGELWDAVSAVSLASIVAALAVQTLQTVLAGLSYYGILRAAYPEAAHPAPIVTAYAVGVAMNGFLPANIGTFVTLFMFIVLVPGATFAGSFAAYLVQKIFFTLTGGFVYLYLFLTVGGSFKLGLGNLEEHPVATVILVGGIVVLIGLLLRLFWRQVKKLWAQAKQGGVILSRPRRYLLDVFLPSLGSWLSKLAVTGIFLAAYGIPVTFDTIMHVIGSNSIANVASFTPGGVGVTQAMNVNALKEVTDATTATAYSISQQLIVTAWNVTFAIVLVVTVLGVVGGRELVATSYRQAKEKTQEMSEARKTRKAEKEAGDDADGEETDDRAGGSRADDALGT